jgi:hypothetical protein
MFLGIFLRMKYMNDNSLLIHNICQSSWCPAPKEVIRFKLSKKNIMDQRRQINGQKTRHGRIDSGQAARSRSLMSKGQTIEEVMHQLGISDATY